MYKASAGVLLPTSIIGSLPRPAWHTVQLGSRTFLEAMVNARWREQYEDAVSTHFRAQEVAGLDICTDGDAHYDEEIGGWSWQSYPLTHMAGFSREVALTPPAVAAARDDLTRPARSEGIAAHRRPARPRQSAIRRDVEGRTAAHSKAGQVRHDHARAARRRRP
jgi:methionine synthase II (cobalamin-independent)